MYSAFKLNKQSDNIQPWRKPFLIWNHSVVLCPVLTVASWLDVYIPQKSICWSLIPSMLVVGGRTLGRWLGHEGGMILMYDVSSQGLQQKWPQLTIMLTAHQCPLYWHFSLPQSFLGSLPTADCLPKMVPTISHLWEQALKVELSQLPHRRIRNNLQSSLVVQWLRIRPPSGTWVRTLGQEVSTCRGASKPIRHDY